MVSCQDLLFLYISTQHLQIFYLKLNQVDQTFMCGNRSKNAISLCNISANCNKSVEIEQEFPKKLTDLGQV